MSSWSSQLFFSPGLHEASQKDDKTGDKDNLQLKAAELRAWLLHFQLCPEMSRFLSLWGDGLPSQTGTGERGVSPRKAGAGGRCALAV